MGYKVYFADFQYYKLIYFHNIRDIPGLAIQLKINLIFQVVFLAQRRNAAG
jgi:hypothetical protein